MTELRRRPKERERVSGSPWLPRKGTQLGGFEERCPRRVVTLGKLVSTDTCSTVCVSSIYFKLLLNIPQGIHQKPLKSVLSVLRVLDGEMK